MQDAVAVERQVEDDRVAGRGLAEPLDAEFADLDVLQRVAALALVDADIDRLLIVVRRLETTSLLRTGIGVFLGMIGT